MDYSNGGATRVLVARTEKSRGFLGQHKQIWSGVRVWHKGASGDLALKRGRPSHPAAVELFVQFPLANDFINDFAQRVHTFQVR